MIEPVYPRYLEALLDGDGPECGTIVSKLHEGGAPLRSLYVDLFQRSLDRVGELWEADRISVATEHLATAITRRLLGLVQADLFSGPRGTRTVVLACVADEYHELGAQMAADLFELSGWRGLYLGASTPVPDLLRFVGERRPQLVGLSLAIAANLPRLHEALDALRATFPSVPLAVGGQAFRSGAVGAAGVRPGVEVVRSLEELDRLARRVG
ncbi:MAG: cobalamin-dependent protein [Thermoanaerobaculia bacterium]|nr:cobalamin-dependent protein [Thermoanaerobaculia bacterium]